MSPVILVDVPFAREARRGACDVGAISKLAPVMTASALSPYLIAAAPTATERTHHTGRRRLFRFEVPSDGDAGGVV